MGCTSSNAIQEEENSKNINPKSINQNKDIVPNKTQTDKDINTLQNNNTKEKTISQQEKQQDYEKRELPEKQEEIKFEKSKIEVKEETKQFSKPINIEKKFENNLDNKMNDNINKNTPDNNLNFQMNINDDRNNQNNYYENNNSEQNYENSNLNTNQNYQYLNKEFNNNNGNINNINNNFNNNQGFNKQLNNQNLNDKKRNQVLNNPGNNMGINKPIDNNQDLGAQIRNKVLNDIAKNMGITTPITSNEDLNEQLRNQILNNMKYGNNNNYNTNNNQVNNNSNNMKNINNKFGNMNNNHNMYGYNNNAIYINNAVYDSHNVVNINNSHNVVNDSHNVINNNNVVNNNNKVVNINNVKNINYTNNIIEENYNDEDRDDPLNYYKGYMNNNDNNIFNNNINVKTNKNININRNININPNINSNDVFGLINNVMNFAMGNGDLSELNKFNNNININYNNNNNDDDYEDQGYNEEERIKRREEKEEEIKKWEEERRKKREEEQKRKKEWMKKTPEEVAKLEEERYKREEENILSGIKDRIEAQKKYKENRLKNEQIEKEMQNKDEKRWKSYQKLGVQYHTQEEIKLFSKEIMEFLNFQVYYDIQPNLTTPYNSGKISQITYDKAVKYINFLRYTAGLSHNIGMNEKYNKLAQDASLLMKLNNKLAHAGHPRPSGLDKKIYDSGVEGCAESNIAYGPYTLMKSIFRWASDEDAHNFPKVGHRRWLFNPTMKNTGLGYVERFSAMYAFDGINDENHVKNVAWPCQNMPIEFFGDNYPWSLSTGQILNKKVKVTITNIKTNKVTIFDRITNDKFAIDNEEIGIPGCVIFRPNFKYKDGDSYRVDVNCTDFSVSYDVNFFSLKNSNKKELIGTVKSSCIKKGKLIYFSDENGIMEEYTELLPHDEEIISLSKANCKIKGRKKFRCCYCCQTFDEEIGIQPHDYSLIHINNYQTEGTCKDCGKKIKFNHPTTVNIWFLKRNSSQYSTSPPSNNPIGSIINVWVEGVNGDKDYNRIIFEVSDPELLQLPKIIKNDPNNELKVIGKGRVEVTYYPKFNPTLKKSFRLNLG